VRFGVRDELVVVLASYGLAAGTVDLFRHAVLLSSPYVLPQPGQR
jgi:hypothetical protein